MSDFDIFEKDQNTGRLKYTVSVAMLAVGAIMVYEKLYLGLVFAFVGLGLLFATWSRRNDRSREIAKINNMAEFEKEFENSRKYPGMGVAVTENYAVVVKPALKIYRFGDMAKFEVGIAKDKEKTLFLTDGDGKRHPIARTFKGDGNQADFDEVYYYVSSKFRIK